MKLTEAKLKQMILEAIKNKSFQDFGISTPDEKLRAELGDEMYGKIQSLDKNQADMMKQGLDPSYPQDIKQESINDILEPLGFEEFRAGELNRDDLVYKVFEKVVGSTIYQVVFSFSVSTSTTATDWEDFKRHTLSIRYVIDIDKIGASPNYNLPKPREKLLRKVEYIKTPNMFALDMSDEQEREQIESLIIKKEKDAIIKALGELT